jgi:hypothetical protein
LIEDIVSPSVPLLVQWQKRGGVKDFSDISGATSLTYQPPALSSSSFPYQYRRKMSTLNCGDFYSNVVDINVFPVAVAGSIVSNQTICYNASPSQLNVMTAPSGGDGSFDYQWEYSLNGSTGWTEISGAEGGSYSPPALTVDTWYRVKFISICSPVYSNVIKITVSQPFSVGSISADQTICSGSTPARLESETDGSGGKGMNYYSWYVSTNGSTYSAVSPSGREKYYQPPALSADTWYKRKFYNDCGNDYSNAVKISMASPIVGGAIGSDSYICYNTSPGQLTNETAASGGLGTISYSWEYSLNNSSFTAISSTNSATYTPSNLTQTTYYRRKATNNCGSAYSNTVTITVADSEVAGTIAANQTICKNTSPATLTNSSYPSGGKGTWSYQWQSSLTGTGGWSDVSGQTSAILNPGTMTVDKYFRRAELNTCKTLFSNIIFIDVANDVSGGEIADNQDICYNYAPAQFTNETSPSGGKGTWNYVWKKAASQSGPWTALSSSNSLSYTSGALTTKTYFMRTSSNDCGSANSNVLTVTIADPLSPGSIGNAQSICYFTAPSAISNAAAASGGAGTVTYKWFKSSNGTSGWSEISNTNSTTYSPGTLTSTTYYKRVAYDNCTSESSNVICITVYPEMVAGSVSESQIICYDTAPDELESVTLPSGGFNPFSYQWQYSLSGTGGWEVIQDETGVNLNLSNQTQKRYYRRMESNYCGYVTSNTLTIDVLPDVTPGTIEASHSVCYNTVPNTLNSLTLPAGGTGSFDYVWQWSSNGVDFWTDISGANGVSYTPEALTDDTWYRRKEINSCETVYSNVVKITVAEPTQHGVIFGEQSICYNAIPDELTNVALPQGGLNGWEYQWQASTDGEVWSDILGAESSTYQPLALTDTTYFKRLEINDCEETSSNSIRVSVAGELVAGSIGSDQLVCSNYAPDELTNITSPSGGIGGFSYTWEKSPNGTGGWEVIEGEVSQTLNPSPATAERYIRRVETNATCGSVYSNSVHLTIRPSYTPGVIGYSQTLCNGVLPQPLDEITAPSGGEGGFSFHWEKSDNGIDWFDIENQISTTYSPPSNGKLTSYRRVIQEVCGEMPSNVVTIDIKPSLTGGDIGYIQTLCPGEAPEKIVSLNPALGGFNNYSYEWHRSPSGVSGDWVTISGAVELEYTPNAISSGTRYFRRKVTDDCGISYSNYITVTVNDLMQPGEIGDDQTICKNATPEPIISWDDPSGWEGEFSYVWKYSEDGLENWIELPDNQTAYLNIGSLSATRFFRRDVEYKCGTVQSNVTKITVNEEFIAGTIGISQNIVCYNQQPMSIESSFLPSGGNGEYSFRWYMKEENGQLSEILGETLSTYQPPALTETTTFVREDIDLCGTKKTNEVTIYVSGEFFAGRIGENQSILYGEAPSILEGVDEPTGGEGGYTYQWRVSTDSINWNNIVGATDEHYQPSKLYQTTYFRRRTINTYCGEIVTNTVKITVSPDLQPGSLDGDKQICYNQKPSPIGEETSPSGGNGDYSYQFQVSLNSTDWEDILNATNATYQPEKLTETKHFRRRVTNGSLVKYTPSIKVTVNPFIPSPLTNEDALYCRGSLVRVDITNAQAKAYWYNEEMEKVHEGSVFYVESLEDDATYYVFNLDEDECFSDSAEVELTTDKINASFTFDQTNHINEGQKVNFTSTSFGAVQWLWDFDMGETYSVENPTIYYNFAGNYDVYLKVWSELGCFDEILEPEIVSVLPVTDVSTDGKGLISVFPNPFSSSFYVSGENIQRIEVYNALGSLVLSKVADSNTVQIDASTFSQGLYLIKVYTNSGFSTLRVIKE